MSKGRRIDNDEIHFAEGLVNGFNQLIFAVRLQMF
ncbi:Uncharacterised protein [Vibrio cholerae]|nr:Uncharacterised protein [Vibrio cholerae]CSH98354.1 Uncharacterised protein [Vibrio cholerae]